MGIDNSQGTMTQNNGGKRPFRVNGDQQRPVANNGSKQRFAVNQNEYTNKSMNNNPYLKKTRAGLLPDDDRVPYSIKTQQIINYLQHKVDVMISDVNNHLPEGMEPLRDIPLKGYTIKFTSTHYPIILIMPGSVEYNPQRAKRKKQGPRTAEVDISQDVADDDNSGDKTQILRPLYSVLQTYMYEKGLFRNANKCSGMRLSNDQRNQCAKFSTPKRTKQKGGGTIMLMLDPFAIIHEMLEFEGDMRSFYILMQEPNKIKDGEFKYNVKRTYKKAKKGNKGISELKSLMRMGSGGTGATLK